MSSAAAEFIFQCGVLDFNTLLSSDHRPLYIDIDIPCLLGYPVHGTIRAMKRDLKLNDPCIIDAYQATLIQQLINHNVGPSSWAPDHESRFNAIYHDFERAMHCAINNCRRKSFKKHTWTFYTKSAFGAFNEE
jgi:hypothetical protein